VYYIEDKGGIKGTDEDEELITITDVDPVVAADWAEGATPDLQAADSSRVVTTNLTTDRSTEGMQRKVSNNVYFVHNLKTFSRIFLNYAILL